MIKVRDLSVKYQKGSTEVVRKLNIEIQDRRIVIVGSNGSGKTTLIKSILGLVPEARGIIEVGGRDVRTMSGNTSVGTNLPEVYDLSRGSVKDQIGLWAGLKNSDPENALKLIEHYGLSKTLSRKMHNLSTGERKMVCNILALAFDPGIVLLDEPFDNVDQQRRLMLLSEISGYMGEVILVTHEIHLLKQLSGWSLYFMINGELWGEFDPVEIERLYLSRGRHPNSLFTADSDLGEVSVTLDSGEVQLVTANSISNALEEVALK